LVVRVLVAQAALAIARVASGEPVARVGLAELAVRGELAGLAAQVAQEALAELAVRGELAGLAAQEALAELAGLVVQVVELELLIAPVAEQALAIVRVEALELDQVVAVPVRDPVALLPKSKSVTAAHHPGLAPVPKRVEDLAAAAAETTRDPAATEVVAAWAAAE
jgi:hypothetical protein